MRTLSSLRTSVLATALVASMGLAGCADGGGVGAVAPADEAAAATVHATEVPELGTSADLLDQTQVVFIGDDGERDEIAARVASDAASRQVGLMRVEELPDGVGMVFLMGEPVDHGFWMRDTIVPLDIAYIGADGRIVSILQMEPCTDYVDAREDCPSYAPGEVYVRTVEVRQGWFAEHGIEVGDEVIVEDSASPDSPDA